MNKVALVLKSERIASALRSLGVSEDTELSEIILKDFTQGNYDQVDSSMSIEELKNEYELLDIDVLDRIIREGKEVLVKIVERAYTEAYYEVHETTKISI